MAAGSTYTPIATTTLSTNAASYTFSSIPQTYTDLVLVTGNITGSTFDQNYAVQVGNGSADSGANYCQIGFYGNGASSVPSWNQTSTNKHNISYSVGLDTRGMGVTNIMNYSNTTTRKGFLTRGGGLDGTYNASEGIMGIWLSTSAIDTVKVYSTGSLLYTGSTLTLYGISAA